MDIPERCKTPESPTSPLARSLDLSSSTIDELTGALSDLTSQEPAAAVVCCCRKEECENTVSWLSVKEHLESRLILSAEVGQALLQKHEEYVRQREKKRRHSRVWSQEKNDADPTTEERLSEECDKLSRERTDLEKRLNVALVNNEVTEVSNKTLLQELQEARDTISRLTVHHARSMGWDARLTASLKERDDIQQERDSESHRARLAESRFAALKDKTNKLQSEVRRLQEALEEKRLHRLKSSESILSEARSRLETVRNSMGASAKAEQEGLTSVLETLVNDNDVLKRDNAELQRLLSESREDLHAIQEEVEEQRANMYPPPRSGPPTSPLIRHYQGSSVTSLSLSPHTAARRNYATETPSRPEPLTPPDSTRRPLSPLDPADPHTRWNSFNYPHPRSRRVSSSTQIDYDIEEDSIDEEGPESDKRKGGHRTFLLLTRSRAVQTDPYPDPSPIPSHLTHLTLSTPPDPRSESSSFSESVSSHVSGIFDRATALLHKMTSADALTLTNRLKRQNLKGADLNHLSRSTVSNIVAEAIELRSQFRMLLEDEKIIVTCTRRDLRVLFSFLKDVFMEMGQLRVSLNDVILDPSCAQRVSEHALNPTKALEQKDGSQNAGPASGASWIAPLSRLFSGVQKREQSPGPGGRAPTRSNTGFGPGLTRTGAPRLAPKLAPALAASTTTVNVEFSGSGVGRATTTLAPPQIVTSPPASETQSVAPSINTASVMEIFAGAPKPQEDPWVVLPRHGPRRVQSTYLGPNKGNPMGAATLGRSNFKKANRLSMSRNVDAVIDSEQALTSVLPEGEEEAEDDVSPLPAYRPLRRRGLSDSSIHSTFTSHGDDQPGSPSSPKFPRTHSPQQSMAGGGIMGDPMGQLASGFSQWSDGTTSVFQALQRTVQNLRLTASASSSAVAKPVDPALPSAASSAAAALVSPMSSLQRSEDVTSSDRESSSKPQPSYPNSPVVQAPSPISQAPSQSSNIEQPAPQSAVSPGILSPQATPRSARFRQKGATPGSNNSSRPSTPKSGTRERGLSNAAGIGGGFLPNISLGSWIPGSGDVLDAEHGGIGSPTMSPRDDDVFSGYATVRPQRRIGRHSEARASRDFF